MPNWGSPRERKRSLGQRVGLVISGNDGGGVETSLVNLCRYYDRSRFAIRYIAIVRGGILRRLEAMGVGGTVLNIPHPLMTASVKTSPGMGMTLTQAAASLVWIARCLPPMVSSIRRSRLDLLHTHRPTHHLLGGLASKICGIPCVWHLRGILNKRAFGGMAVPAFNAAARLLASSVVANSRASRDVLSPLVQNKTHVVYNGVPVELIQSEQLDRGFWSSYGVPEKAPLVGLIGRINPNKGQEFFIRAAERVLLRSPDVRFVIVGDAAPGCEEFRARLVREAKARGLEDKVLFAGRIERAYRLSGSFDVAAFCTQRTESCPNVVLEAMAAGRPVVATAVGGANELVQEGRTGFLVPPQDVDAFAERILWLFANPSGARRMGKTAYTMALENFSVMTSVTGIERAYSNVARQPEA